MAKKKTAKPDPEDLVLRLFQSYESQIGENLWPWEKARWYELVFCILTTIGEPQVLAGTTRRLTNTLSDSGLLDLHALAKLKPTGSLRTASKPLLVTISTLLRQAGFTPEKSRSAVTAICEAASGIEKNYNGRVQDYLSKYGNHMLDKIGEDFGFSQFEDARRAISIWLQNTLNMPVPASDVLSEQACKSLGVSYKALVQAANKKDINVALLDDALRAYWESKSVQEEDEVVRVDQEL